MKMLLRGDTLLSIAALALAATVVMGREAPTLEVVDAGAAPEPVLEIDFSGLDRSAMDLSAPERDPFGRRSFGAPPPPAAVAVAPAPVATPMPQRAPVLPFRYVGRFVDEGQTILFLGRGDEVFTAHVGQAWGPHGGQWRLEEIAEREIVFTYLPLKSRQILSL